MDYIVSGKSTGTSIVLSGLLTFTPNTPDFTKSAIIGECAGSPGVRIKLVDLSQITTADVPNSVAGIVGFSTKGPFNKILKISSTAQLDAVLGTGFNNPAYNQGLYAARAILNNGGFVEYVRPYGETVDLDSQDQRELKSDAYVFNYDYNPNTMNSTEINFFAATRNQDDGYSPFGKREIFTSDKALINGKNFDFTLDKSLEVNPTKNKIPLFSIINEDPSITIRASDDLDSTSDKLVVSFATHYTSRVVTDFIELMAQPADGDTFSTIDENGVVRVFEFDSDTVTSVGNIAVQLGTDHRGTIDELVSVLSNNMPNHDFTKVSSYKILATVQFGIKDSFVQSTQNVIFTEITDSNNTYNVGQSEIQEQFYLSDNSIGYAFLHMGLADEKFVKDSFSGEPVKRYQLNSVGLSVSKYYLMVDYYFGGSLYSFSGTIVPMSHNSTNLYIKPASESVANAFQLVVNTNEDFNTATSDPDFNLGKIKSTSIVKATTTSNITLSGLHVIDGIVLSVDDRVLVKDQTNSTQNGIYKVSIGDWERVLDANESMEFNSKLFIYVESGSTYGGSKWTLVTQSSKVVLGTTPLQFCISSEQPIVDFVFKKSFDEEDPAFVNDTIWKYSPKNQITTETLVSAWQLFLDKGKSQADFLLSAGTCIKNLFSKGMEELDYVVIDSMLNICDLRKDMFVIFDGVDEQNINNALIKMTGVGSFGDKGRWGSIFDGRSIFSDKNYIKLEVPAVKSIEMGAIISNNRRGGLYWISPAGKDFGTVPVSLASRQKYIRKYGRAEDVTSDFSKLYAAHINPTRIINNSAVIYGQKTMLKRDTDLNRLNVTMLVAGLHKRFNNYLDNKMLKLNTYSLRLSIREELSNILNKIKSANPSGLVSFDVVCDDTNNTKDTISQNKLIIDIYLYPAKTSECIILRTTVQRTGNNLNLSNFELKIR